jgi:hypothetical protein
MDSNPDLYNLSTRFLQNVLEECEGMDQAQFSELLVIGNEQHVASLLTAAAQLDIKFLQRVENAYCMGAVQLTPKMLCTASCISPCEYSDTVRERAVCKACG